VGVIDNKKYKVALGKEIMQIHEDNIVTKEPVIANKDSKTGGKNMHRKSNRINKNIKRNKTLKKYKIN